MFASPGGFDRCVQGKEVCLARYLFDDVDLLRYLLHRRNRFSYCLCALPGVLRCLEGDLFCLYGVFGVLTDIGCHLLHARGSFLGGRGLLR